MHPTGHLSGGVRHLGALVHHGGKESNEQTGSCRHRPHLLQVRDAHPALSFRCVVRAPASPRLSPPVTFTHALFPLGPSLPQAQCDPRALPS